MKIIYNLLSIIRYGKSLKYVKENTAQIMKPEDDDLKLIPKSLNNISGLELEELLNLEDK